jgi:glycosyltransferase involved in cell wall biosynthesis
MPDTAMPLRLGIGVITFNRCELLRSTIAKIRACTVHPFTSLVVADDGSTDGTQDMLREQGVACVGGANAGVTWNKNRALFLLSELVHCDIVILLEDDVQPNAAGWDAPWLEAGQRWGHINLARDDLKGEFLYGRGTAADPIGSKVVSAQCAAFSREALAYGGYFDSRFHGYGHGHVEHTIRLVRTGYGGAYEDVEGLRRIVFRLIHGRFDLLNPPTFRKPEEVERNLAIAHSVVTDQSYRAPWRDETEMRRFRDEMAATLARHPGGFALHPGNARTATPAGRLPWFGVALPP